MKFQINAKIEKTLWASEQNQSRLYQVTDLDSQKAKKWSVFTEEELTPGYSYTLKGVISESKDKKLKDENAKDIWRTTFNVTEIHNLESEKNNFEDAGEIPF